ncbi:28 kDa ribonucleoprotein, chloroplastic [Vitis riparia]|uniref:28 kDa ribonucleoprotein, chloroplastic n=1 Tax=Vitis riparia TaxID=96939 RepID=UPI00155A625E|nr:28 kDa ribonucleoprotein, chloroplastic [Vitis riparia]
MAATAAAAIGSSFSTTMHTLKLSRSKHCPSDALLRIISTPIFKVPSISHSHVIDPPLPLPISHKWRAPRISAAVAQEEAAATAPVEEEEQQQGQEEGEQVLREEGAESPVNTKLYFGNLPYSCDSAQLAGIIQNYGSPELVEVLYDRDTGRSRGFAFVTMSSVEDCNAVIENLDGSEYGGRTLRVNFSDKPKPKLPLYPETEYKLFVGNLSWSVTSESLNQVFQEYGNVIGARVLYDGETGRSRGYGFVCYSTKAEMDTALESLNGVELEGRAIRISLAQGRRS